MLIGSPSFLPERRSKTFVGGAETTPPHRKNPDFNKKKSGEGHKLQPTGLKEAHVSVHIRHDRWNVLHFYGMYFN